MAANNSATLTLTTPADREIVMTRVFDAPRQMVFDAWTRPEHLAHWFGARGWALTVCEIDLRVGGAWRYVLRRNNGQEMELTGEYREVAAPERIVYVERTGCDVAHQDGQETLVTLAFAEHDGKTTLTFTLLYPSREIRDAMLKTGMEHGVGESYDRLEEYLRR